jgi:hypothetical protein
MPPTTTTLPPTAFPEELLAEANAAMDRLESMRFDVVTVTRNAADSEEDLLNVSTFAFGNPIDGWLEGDVDDPDVESREFDGVRYLHDPDDGDWRIEEEYLSRLTTDERIRRAVQAGMLELEDAEAFEDSYNGTAAYRIEGVTSQDLGSLQVSIWRTVRPPHRVSKVVVSGMVPSSEYGVAADGEEVFVESTVAISGFDESYLVLEPPGVPTLFVQAETIPFGFQVPASWEAEGSSGRKLMSDSFGRTATYLAGDDRRDPDVGIVVFEDDLEEAGFGRVNTDEFTDFFLFNLTDEREVNDLASVQSTYGIESAYVSVSFPDLSQWETIITVFDETRGYQVVFFGKRGAIEEAIEDYIPFVLSSVRQV